MHDMIGASGMLRGWTAVWQMDLVWLLTMLVVSVTVTTLVEWLISALRSRAPEPEFLVDHAALDADLQVEPR